MPHRFPLPGPQGCGAPTTHGTPRVLIAGVGNELLADDGVGVYAVRELQRHPLPNVTMVEIGTAVLHGLSFLEAADRVLVIDAAKGGHSPGTIYLFDAAENTGDKAVSSIHAMGLREAARFLSADKPVPPITVLGVEPGSLNYQMGLSDAVEAALPRVIELARSILEQWRHAEALPAATAKGVEP